MHPRNALGKYRERKRERERERERERGREREREREMARIVRSIRRFKVSVEVN